MSVARITCPSTGARPARGQHVTLACAIGAEAKAAGFTLRKITASHQATSPSRYLHLYDRADRYWLVRVSNHAWGGNLVTSIPNLDLVSRDGQLPAASRKAVQLFFADAITGHIDWRDPQRVVARARDRRRR